jgi:hypothetical protein
MGRSMINENNEIVFPYQVNTIMPIIGLSCGNLMVPTTAKLTKEDVLICLKKAPVFRRFGSNKLERVTISNIDRLHNEKFMDEVEYEKFLDKQGDNRGKVTETIAEKKKETNDYVEKEPIKPTPVVKEETVTEESIVEEAETIENIAQTDNIIEDEVAENISDVGVSENVTGTLHDEINENNNNRYNNKKKHNR